jgi:hypothetical protein
MSSSAPCFVPSPEREQHLEALFDEIAELTGQRNAIDGRLVDIIAQIDHDDLWQSTGARSVPALIAWKTGISPANARTLAAVAHRRDQFPRCTAALREGRVSLDQIGVLATRSATGSDAHYADLITVATVNQLRTAVKMEPRPQPENDPHPDDESERPPELPEPNRSFSKTSDETSTTWCITLPHPEAATVDAAVQSHHDALIAQWKRDHPDHPGDGQASDQPSPFPHAIDAFLRLVEAGWDTDVAARPHGHRTTVVVHLDLADRIAALHLGPLLSDGDRRYLTCDATCEVWFHRGGEVIGAGRETRVINRRLRRALEHRDHCCVIPGCAATRGLHAHHIQHWEDGGTTDLHNLVLLCPYHHRLHHRGGITVAGTADHLVVTDRAGRVLTSASLARPPTTLPPAVPPCPGPLGERADWWWYPPYEPKPPPPSTN